MSKEKFLVGDLQQLRQMIALMNFPPLVSGNVEKNITRKERLLENHRFAPILVGGSITGQGGGKTPAFTKLNELLFATRPCMGDKPKQVNHEISIGYP
ncbi:MAG: hypothetical protein ABSA47_16670 [Verrucomicrobiota bacterium]